MPEAGTDAEAGSGTDAEAGSGTDAEAGSGTAPHFRVVSVIDVTVDLPDSYAVVTLMEDDPPSRSLQVPLGLPDATALAYALRRVSTPRPLTHQLFVDVLGRLQADLAAVRLVGRTNGTYLAELHLMSTRGSEVVPCRPSDGLTLALRQAVNAPVLVDERLLVGTDDVVPG